jgi:peptidoglycan/LPS O-acetylase OafA/YrhL
MVNSADFRRDIQGLRAIAVLSVVIFHASAGFWLAGGFIGVDVFFVISGFLITGILLRDNALGRFSVTDFYRRRIRRLFPVLMTVLLFTLATGAAVLSATAYSELAATAAATVLFVSNFAFLRLSGYFDESVEYKPLLHTWSLAVEEQFYIFFPILLSLLWRFARRWIGIVLLGLALLSLAASIWMSGAHPSAAFYLAPTRAFELLIGALLACHPHLMRWLGQGFRDALSLLGLLLIAASMISIDNTFAFPGAIALVPCLATALVISAGQSGPSLGGRWISFAPFILFGDISYSLYLWHWPLLALARNWVLGPLNPAAATVIALLSMALAYASWRWIEQPFLRGLPQIRPITTGLAMIAVVSGLSGTLVLMRGLPQRFSPGSQALFAAKDDFNRRRPECHSGEGKPIPYNQNCTFGSPDASPSVAIWADSHGAELAVALGERMAKTQGAVMQITASACPPALGYNSYNRKNCTLHNSETLDQLVADSRIRQVVMLANFATYPQAKREELERGFEAAVQTLSTNGKKVIIFEPIPVFDFDAPSALGLIASRGGKPSAWGLPLQVYRSKNAPFLELISRVAKATSAVVIPTADILCRDDLCGAFADGEGVLYFNADHLSVTGARRLAMAIPLTVVGNNLDMPITQNGTPKINTFGTNPAH